jgi:peptide deformylase
MKTDLFSLSIKSLQDVDALQLILAPNKALSTPVPELSEMNDDTLKTVERMAKTMYVHGGVGIAGNQVAVDTPIRAIVFDPLMKKVNDKPIADPHVIFNPVIIEASAESEVEEGCLSFPSVFLKKKRAGRIIVRGRDVNWEEHEIEAYGLTALILQHEIDHLDGKQ